MTKLRYEQVWYYYFYVISRQRYRICTVQSRKIFVSMDIVENTLELENIADMLMVGTTLSKWKELKPTEEIQQMSLAFTRIVLYVNKLQMEKKGFDLAIRNIKYEKNSQIAEWKLRAENAEKKLEKLSNPLI